MTKFSIAKGLPMLTDEVNAGNPTPVKKINAHQTHTWCRSTSLRIEFEIQKFPLTCATETGAIRKRFALHRAQMSKYPRVRRLLRLKTQELHLNE